MGRIMEIDIVDLAYNGKSIGYDENGKVTFVKGGLPGEKVKVKVVKNKRNYNQAKLLEIITKSPERIPAVCEHDDICGGCTWQDLEYERQLSYKREQVIACLEHIGGIKDIEVGEIQPSPEKFYYRNKMEYSFHIVPKEEIPEGFVLGMHERGRFDRIFNINKCYLQSEMSNQVFSYLRSEIARLDIPIYDLIAHRGFLRFVIYREGKFTGQSMLNIVTGKGDFVAKQELTESLTKQFPDLTTIVWTVNSTMSNIAKGDVREILYGPGYIEEEILGFRFRVSPGSFFQTNSRQTEALYKTAIEFAAIREGDTVLDLYCGAGTIGLCASAGASEVIGIELEEEAVASARLNAEINSISNCRFYAGAVRKVLLQKELKSKSFSPVFVDPPRAGMHPKAFKRLLEINTDRIVYISCNPSTFARDAAELIQAGYRLRRLVPFDMFPHTMHIELVSCFEKI
ncbi:MAG: 23S rRNA (uracil(1939)-C(5))-methyltransferase RlmD [candidate division Zixibacteria bacterium]|nr:23S rRNA (uracil(1939)-C(5))-methyltransferase RlmD [candidate division Zixibacteria bacterium]